jgi:hypothetical protein
MKVPGESIGGARVICWSPLDDRHQTTGSCHRTIDGETRSPYAGIAIGKRLGDPMVYLFYCDADWNPVTDTYHSNIGRAKEEAELEFNGVSKTWNDVD